MTQSLTPEQQFLMGGGGAPSAFGKYDGPGTRRGGKIVERPELRQQTEYKTNELLYWKDGNPRMQLVVTVQTDQRDPEREDDDGKRRFYVKSNMQHAVRDAIKTAGASGLEVGGTLYITRLRQEGENEVWVHSAEYIPAAQNFVANGDGGGETNGAASNGHQGEQRPPQPEPEPETGVDAELEAALAKLPAEQAAAMRAANINLDGLKAMGLI